MKIDKSTEQIAEDLKIEIGIGVTEYNGRDSYPFYVSEILPNGVIGLYSPNSHFKNNWTEGSMVVDAFDPKEKSEFYIKRRYGNWWKVEANGKPLCKWGGKYTSISFGAAISYQDPSF